MKRLAAIFAHTALFVLVAGAVYATAPGVINSYVGVCNPDFATRCLKPLADGSINVNATPAAGTADVNLKQVNGATTTAFGSGVVGTETQRVVLATDVTSPVKVASGQIASGAIASGAVASGAIASGAVASGAYALGSISDGANVTLGAKADAKSTATDTTAITVMQVLKEISFMAQTPAALPANQSVNIAQTNGGTVAVGHGTAAAALRVELPTDGTGVVGLAAGAAVIGHVIADTGSTTAATQATAANLKTEAVGAVTAADAAVLTATLKTLSEGAVYNGTTYDLWRGAANSLNSTGTGLATAQAVGQCDDTSPTSLTENQFGNVREDCTTHAVATEIMPTAAASAGIAAVVSSALETGHILKGSAGNLYGVAVTTTTVAGYLEVFNSTTVPSAGAVTPVAACYAGAFATCALQFSPPQAFSTGISVAFSASTTPFTKTDSATAFISGQTQ